MADRVIVRQGTRDTLFVGPDGSPAVGEGPAPLDAAVLEVSGGYLGWSVLAGQRFPVAVIDDADTAQEWIWAVYGAGIALAVDEFGGAPVELPPDPGLPALVDTARKLGYAHWAARWWPASTLDGITPLDELLLDAEIATLTAECDLLVDGADAIIPIVDDRLDGPAQRPGAARAEDYALAAGPVTAADALVLARGVGGWDWRRCPPGLVDASERALSWEVRRRSGATTIRITAVAAPRLRTAVPPHLHPHAVVRTPAATAAAELILTGDTWTAEAPAPAQAESGVTVEILMPGVGTPETADLDGARIRRQLREFAVARLRTAAQDPGDDLLLAEIAAAATDTDF